MEFLFPLLFEREIIIHLILIVFICLNVNYYMNRDKENYSFNQHFYSSKDYGASNNKNQSSYSNISFSNQKNGEEITIPNINN